MKPLEWYRRLRPGDQIVVKTAAGLAAGDVFFTWLYLSVPPALQGLVILQGVIWSMTTSVGALYYALKIARDVYNRPEVQGAIHNPEQLIGEIKKGWEELRPLVDWVRENREKIKRMMEMVSKFKLGKPGPGAEAPKEGEPGA